MSELDRITPLTEVMEDVHNEHEQELMAKYVPEKKARRYPLNPDREKSRSEYDPDIHEADFEVAQANGELLHNASRPPVVIAKEKPEHRFLVFLFAQNSSTREVFEQLGGTWQDGKPVSGTGKYSYQHLLSIRRQAWFQKQLISYLEQCGRDAVTAKLESELGRSLETIVDIRDSSDASPSVRLSAANSLIDRFLGKPTQHVKQESAKDVGQYEKELEDLEAEEASLNEQMKNLNAAM